MRIGRGELQSHQPMGNACLFKLGALGDEAVARIKTEHGHLAVQVDGVQAATPRLVQQQPEDGRADAMAPPRGQHRHPADLARRMQAPGSDDASVRMLGQRVSAIGIESVPFFFLRH